MKAPKAKMKGNEGPKGHPARIWPKMAFFLWNFAIFPFPKFAICRNKKCYPKGQNERKWWPKRPKWKEMKAQKAKRIGNEGPKGQNERRRRPKRPKWKEIKAQKAKMKGNEGPKSQNERKWSSKGKKLQKAAHLSADEICLNFIRKQAVFGNLWRTPRGNPDKQKIKGNEGLKGQNERKWSPKGPKWKEMKAQKAKMKGNEGAKGQKDRKRRAKSAKWKEIWKEIKVQKAKMKGNDGPKGQNERIYERKRRAKRPKWKEMTAQMAKMKGNEGPKAKNCKMQPVSALIKLV